MRGLVFLVTFAVLAWTAAAAPGWLDTAELTAASATLGVAHPPGHPIPVMLGRAAMYLPVGDVYFRAALASALMGALAAVLLYELARKVCGNAKIAVGAALAFAFSAAAWLQGVRAEVYGCEVALVLAAVVWSLERRTLPAAALAAGLALANHHYITLTAVVPAAIAALWQRPRPRAGWIAFGVLGLVAYAYLPLRAAADPLVNWGDARTLDRFWWTVSAQAFTKTIGSEDHEPFSAEAMQVGSAMMDQLAIPAFLLGVLGLYLVARDVKTRRVGLMMVGVVVLGVVGRAALGFDFENPDALGYLLPAIAVMCVAAAAAVAHFVQLVPAGRAGMALAVAVAIAWPASQLARNAGVASQRGAYAAEEWARATRRRLPPDTLLVTAYHETLFLHWALVAVEGDRPDLLQVDRNYLTHPFAAAQAKRRRPELAALIDAGLRGGRPTPVKELMTFRRHVYFELSFNLADDDPVIGQLELYPGFARVARGNPQPRDKAPSVAGAERVRLMDAYLRARVHCAKQRVADGARAIQEAALLAPGDEMLKELAVRCGVSR